MNSTERRHEKDRAEEAPHLLMPIYGLNDNYDDDEGIKVYSAETTKHHQLQSPSTKRKPSFHTSLRLIRPHDHPLERLSSSRRPSVSTPIISPHSSTKKIVKIKSSHALATAGMVANLHVIGSVSVMSDLSLPSIEIDCVKDWNTAALDASPTTTMQESGNEPYLKNMSLSYEDFDLVASLPANAWMIRVDSDGKYKSGDVTPWFKAIKKGSEDEHLMLEGDEIFCFLENLSDEQVCVRVESEDLTAILPPAEAYEFFTEMLIEQEPESTGASPYMAQRLMTILSKARHKTHQRKTSYVIWNNVLHAVVPDKPKPST
jgi:hypothetical protein